MSASLTGHADPAALGAAAADRAGAGDAFWSTLAVVGLAVSQPLLELLGRTPTFFVARSSPTLDVVLTGLVVGLVVPLWIGAIVAMTWRINPRAGAWVHAVVLGGAVALLTVTVLEAMPLPTLPGGMLLGVGAAAGVAAVAAYRRWAGARAFLRYAGVAPLVVTGWFLVMAPAADLVWKAPAAATPVAPTTATTPVVMVVFDEFPVATLLDETGELRNDLFPGFARLASQSTWFRNAVGTHERTELALPTILSGVPAEPGGKVPDAADYPDTLFTLLAGSHRVDAVEPVTALCPAAVCTERPRPPAATRWESLAADLVVVAGHVLVPEDLTDAFPPINDGWGNFAASDDEWQLNRRFNRQVAADPHRGLDRFVAGLDRPLGGAELHFAHILLPHSPWTLLPSGQGHGVTAWPEVDGPDYEWTDDAWRVAQGYQRHFLQAQYADRLVGELVDALQRNGSSDDAVLVVAADHGIAMRPGVPFRKITPDTVGDIAAVPLFVKLPGQRRGDVSDYRAETIDILPTIAAAVGVDVPWTTAGTDLFAADLPVRTTSAMIGTDLTVTFDAGGAEKLDVARYHAAWFHGGGPYDLAPPGLHDLLGAAVAGLATAPAGGTSVAVDQDYPPPDPHAAVVPANLTGALVGAPPGDHVVAIAFGGEIVAVTRTYRDDGETRFEAMLPPEALASGSAPDLYLVDRTGGGVTLAPLG